MSCVACTRKEKLAFYSFLFPVVVSSLFRPSRNWNSKRLALSDYFPLVSPLHFYFIFFYTIQFVQNNPRSLSGKFPVQSNRFLPFYLYIPLGSVSLFAFLMRNTLRIQSPRIRLLSVSTISLGCVSDTVRELLFQFPQICFELCTMSWKGSVGGRPNGFILVTIKGLFFSSIAAVCQQRGKTHG